MIEERRGWGFQPIAILLCMGLVFMLLPWKTALLVDSLAFNVLLLLAGASYVHELHEERAKHASGV